MVSDREIRKIKECAKYLQIDIRVFLSLYRNLQKKLMRQVPKSRRLFEPHAYMGPKWKRQSDLNLRFKPLSQQAQSLKMYRAWQKRMVRSIRNSRDAGEFHNKLNF